MQIITLKCNSGFGKIGKARGINMTAKVVGKNFHFSVKNLFQWAVMIL